MDCEISTKSLHTNVLFTEGLKEGWTQCKFIQVKKNWWVNNEINTATTRRKKLLKSFPFVILNTNNIIYLYLLFELKTEF